jgi:predicted nucleotidyltransferase
LREVWIFGSYAHGMLEVGDVDLAVEFDQTEDEAGHVACEFHRGRRVL